MLQARSSRFSCKLLEILGTDAWDVGWDRLWQGPTIYICIRLVHLSSPKVELIYVGQTMDMSRHVAEHMSRVCSPGASTQQPFYNITEALRLMFNISARVLWNGSSYL